MNENSAAPYGALLLRLSLGIMFLTHSLLLKVFVFTIPGTVGFFESIGYPGFFAYLVIFGEIIAGVLLILGVFTRLVSIATVPILIGAAAYHWGNGWVFSAEGGGWEYPVFLAIALVVQALLGDGAHALQPRVAKLLGSRQAA